MLMVGHALLMAKGLMLPMLLDYPLLTTLRVCAITFGPLQLVIMNIIILFITHPIIVLVHKDLAIDLNNLLATTSIVSQAAIHNRPTNGTWTIPSGTGKDVMHLLAAVEIDANLGL